MTKLSAEARDLLTRVGEADGPSTAECARVTARLAASLPAPALAQLGAAARALLGTAPTAGLTLAAKLTVAKIGLCVLVGAGAGFVATAPVLLLTRSPSSAASAGVSAAPAQTVVPIHAEQPSSGELRELRAATPSASPAREVRSAAEPTPTVEPVGTAGIAEENRLLGAAQRELSAGHPGAALDLLDEHAARFPAGALVDEQRAARVVALCSLGRIAEARAGAARFLASSPRSPLVPRVRASCGYAPGSIQPQGARFP